jgi:hypothetical protein
MVTVTRNSSNTIQTYKNGSSSVTGSLTGDFRIRQVGQRGNSSRFYQGSIYTTQIYNKALTAAEVLQNYYGGPIVTDGLVLAVDAGNLVSYESGSTTTYSLTGSDTGSLQNGVGLVVIMEDAWSFDGTDDYVSIPGMVLNDYTNFTVNTWVKFNQASRYEIIWSAYTGYFSVIKFPNTIYFAVSGTTGQAASTTTTILANTWYNIVAVRSSGVSYLYLNGILEGTFTGAVNTGGQVSEYRLGNYTTAYYLSGNIANNIIYNKALTASEVAQNYSATKQKYLF